MDIVVFGAGKTANNLIKRIDLSSNHIICFLDNSIDKHYTKLGNWDVLPPDKILGFDFDLIIIASQFSLEITEQLLEMGIAFKKIIPWDGFTHLKKIENRYSSSIAGLFKDIRGKTKIKIALPNYNYSNYHGYSLYKYLPSFIKEKYEVDLIEERNIEKLRNYDVICSSSYDGLYEADYINIEMWHGFPIKKIGLLHESMVTEIDEFEKSVKRFSDKSSLIMSYSELNSTFYNACFPTDAVKYRITGMPRNDLLFEENAVEKLEQLLKKDFRDSTIIFYLPTWRNGEFGSDTDNSFRDLFGFKNGSIHSTTEFLDYLQEQNINLIIKLHPAETNQTIDSMWIDNNRIHFLENSTLVEKRVHLYELLASADIIIGDYSSVQLDTLLIDTPVIYTPTDVDDYKENRGFLIEPYDYLCPGPAVHNLMELKYEIEDLLSGIDSYKAERERVRNLIFRYKDNRSSERVWEEIDQYLSNLKIRSDSF